eukprot:GHVT01037498.1.p1 GENE.GHVT01037498.1~~GHVT01037498.1.p1  ORF type:complete len:111 (-),score=8.48 GHVT01037498.1:2267-2599(-)
MPTHPNYRHVPIMTAATQMLTSRLTVLPSPRPNSKPGWNNFSTVENFQLISGHPSETAMGILGPTRSPTSSTPTFTSKQFLQLWKDQNLRRKSPLMQKPKFSNYPFHLLT